MKVLSAWMYVYHTCAWYPQSSEGNTISGSGVTKVVNLLVSAEN